MLYLLKRFLPPPPPREARAAPNRPVYVRLGLWLLRKVLVIGSIALVVWLAYRRVRSRIRELVPILDRH